MKSIFAAMKPRLTQGQRDERDRKIREGNERFDAECEALAKEHALTFRVHNQRNHFEWRGATLILDWFPSTGRCMVNKECDRSERLLSLDDVRRKLEHLKRHPPRRVLPEKKPVRQRSDECVPDENLRCTGCGKPGAMPFNKKCDSCAFGPLRFAQ